MSMGYEHHCVNIDTPGSGAMHTRGTGRGPNKCRYCGSAVMNTPGMYGVFTWRGDGKYKIENALWSYSSAKVAAHKVLNADEPGLVVRFVRWTPDPCAQQALDRILDQNTTD